MHALLELLHFVKLYFDICVLVDLRLYAVMGGGAIDIITMMLGGIISTVP